MSDSLIKVEGVSKKFCRSLKRSLWYGVQDMGNELLGRSHGGNGELRPDEFWAVKDVSFELKRGECLGLIGHNGAGKTTLLRMLNGLIKPDQGRIEISGRVGALIALGAGFNPILTGRENIYVNGSVLGLNKREIDKKIDEIIDFAEVDEFIDSPVQNYSSGMQVRLGFAIATTINPDVLILDEVLAVGDAAFRGKCYNRIQKIIEKTAVVLVSHNMDQIGIAASCIVFMRRGIGQLYHDVFKGIYAYNSDNKDGIVSSIDSVFHVYEPITRAEVKLVETCIRYAGRLNIEVCLESLKEVNDILFSFTVKDSLEQQVMCCHSSRIHNTYKLTKGKQILRFTIDPLLLHDGWYTWNFYLKSKGSFDNLVWFVNGGSFEVFSSYRSIASIPYLPIPDTVALTPCS